MPLNVQDLLPPLNPEGLPAPLGFLMFFKLLGFILHLWPMHLVFVGPALIALAVWRGGAHSRLAAERLGRVLPFAVALAVNTGIVPLLFLQVTHYRLYYPATILMAWPWFMVVPLLILAYYGIYLYSIQQRAPQWRPLALRAIGFTGVAFLVVGFLFTNALSLMVEPERWIRIWQATDTAGAVSGFGLNLTAPSLLPRWLMMAGLALCSVGAWLSIDTAFFARGESAEYRADARTLAVRLYAIGLAVTVVMGGIYIFGTLPGEVRSWLLSGSQLPLFLLTAAAPLIGFAVMVWQSRQPQPGAAWLVAGTHFLILVLNAVSRQQVQTEQIRPLSLLGAEQINTQWSSMTLFLLCFVVALGVIVWMLRRFWVEAVVGHESNAI